MELDLVDRYKNNADLKRGDSYGNQKKLDVATKYAYAGFPQQARAIWNKVSADEGTGNPRRSAVLAEIAIAEAKAGIDPTRTSDETEALLQNLKHPSLEGDHPWKAETIADLAVANHLYGGKGEPYLDKALGLVRRGGFFTTYLKVAGIQRDVFRVSPAGTLNEALADLDRTSEQGGRENPYYHESESYASLSEANAKSGLFDEARVALSRIDLYADIHGLIDISKIDGLINLAMFEAKAGLSDAEIKTLDQTERRRLLHSTNPNVAQAAAYFYSAP